MDFKLQYLIQEADEQRTVNLQYQALNRTLMSKNIGLKAENKQLKKENEELTVKINRAEDRLNRRPNGTNGQNSYSSSRQYKDIRYFGANGTQMTSSLVDNASDRDAQEVIVELKEQNVKLVDEHERLKSFLDGSKQESDSWRRRAELLNENLLRCKKDLDELRNTKVSDLKRDPRIANEIHKNLTDQIKQLRTKNEELQKRLKEEQEHNILDFDTVKVKAEKELI